MLYIVPTPIGNLQDITLRALDVLKSVDQILAEDTRQAKKLLDSYKIENDIRSYHSFNEHKTLQGIIGQLQEGKTLALISDAGTPGISDPGFLLVRECHRKNIPLTVLPGATALIPALVSSGIPCDKFHFEGFLPKKKGRQTRWNFLGTLEETFVLYESPYRLIKTLEEIKMHCGEDREIAVIKEISKIYETIWVGTPDSVLKELEDASKRKGEFVIVISGKSK